MKPYPLILLVTLVAFGACKSRKAITTTRDTTKLVTKDTTSQRRDQGHPAKYIEHARLDLKDEAITLTSRRGEDDGKVDDQAQLLTSDNYFVHIDKKSGKADTLEANLDNLYTDCDCIIRDVTDSFRLPFLTVQVVTPSEDIYYTNSFVAYENGHFKKLFTIELDAREKGVELHRVGSQLTGLMTGRDEVVDNLEQDYPVTVDTKTFEVTNGKPEKQYIGWRTTATQSFRAHRVKNGQVDSSLVSVKVGAEVLVDTFYRSLGKVRLLLSDTLMVEIKAETAEMKLGHNGAG